MRIFLWVYVGRRKLLLWLFLEAIYLLFRFLSQPIAKGIDTGEKGVRKGGEKRKVG